MPKNDRLFPQGHAPKPKRGVRKSKQSVEAWLDANYRSNLFYRHYQEDMRPETWRRSGGGS